MGELSRESYPRDEAYPDGPAWRCFRQGCTFTTDDDGPDYCPEHPGSPLQRVNRRISLDEHQHMDVVVEYRGDPTADLDPEDLGCE